MAEFSLGLTKTAVEGTLSLVKSAVEEEKKLREKVQNDLVFISGEFEMMQSFLRVANNNNNNDDQQVVRLTWVRQLRNLAFDVEDCVEYVVHLDLDKSSCWGWLRRARQKVYCCAPPLPLDTAIAEIKQLKDRVEDVSQRNMRYSLILHGSDNNNNKLQLPAVTAAVPPPVGDATTYPYPWLPPFHILRDACKATGKWCSNMGNLQELILSGDDGLQVISVCGSTVGGDDLGTASILTEAYWHPEICKKFKTRVWVKLIHPFNHDEFVNTLLAQFYVSSSSHQANAGGVDFREQDNKLPNKLVQKMRRQRYLIVLENVLAVAEWNVIRMHLPDGNNGSRIVVSTPRLRIALMCAGEPYQVSELTKFHGDNQFLCAFFENKTPSDVGEFYRQLRRHGMISVWGADGDDKLNLIDILYNGIIYGWFKEFEWVSDADKADRVTMLHKGIRNRSRKLFGEVEFKRHSWVNVPDDPFNLKDFARRLFLNFHSDDIRASEIRKGGSMGEADLIEWCLKFLFEKEDCLVVINGLQSMDQWDLIKSRFFLSSKPRTKACILVITNEETMATRCVNGHKYQAFNIRDLKADKSIATLINKGSWHYGIRGKNCGRLFKGRRKDALEWANKFKNVGGNKEKDEEEFGVFTVSGDAKDISAKAIIKHAYYVAYQQIRLRSWVDVPRNPFDLTDFSWRLLLDFYSDDPPAKEDAAVGLMEGTVDPIQKCREFLRNEKCLVVINDLWSREDWDSIKGTFLSDSENIQSIIIVSSFDRRFNTYGEPNVLQLGNQQDFRVTFKKEYGSIFHTKRCQKALECTEKIVGRETLVNRLTNCVQYQQGVFSVWGIAGVGKSSLVRTVYYNQMLLSAEPKTSKLDFFMSSTFQAFGWVDVPSPFNLTEFAWRLLLDLYSDDPQANQTAAVSMMEQGQVPILECCKILRELRCLVVIDGLFSRQDWDSIKATFLAEPTKKSAIVVITNEEKVAMHCVENIKSRVNNIRRLEADAALNLFDKISPKGKQLTSEQMELPKSILGKCGGLPKVITAVGKGCTSQKLWLEYLTPLSDNFMGTLETDPEFHGLRPLFSWMQSYFDACSDSIKPCIFYLSIFPAEKNIRRRRLLSRWIAEGYCRDTSDGTTCEENGENFISELVKLSIVQQYSPRNKVFCQINGFFHEYIISRPMEDNLVFALEGRCSFNSARAGQHLTIKSSWDRRDMIVYESIDFSRLRSLTVFGKWESFFICNKKVNMKLLRVLDLEDAEGMTNGHLEQIAKRLTRLKFLSLRGHTKINCLPISVGGMRQLQTLDIRGTSIVMLPLFITKLQKLRYIRAGKTEVWDWKCDAIAADGEDMALAAAQAVRNLPAAATAAAPTIGATPAAPVQAQDTVGSSDTAGSSVSCSNGADTLVSSFLSKLCRCGGHGGVKVPAGIRKLAVLHTLGVVNVKGSWSKSICKELKKLTQLRKLGVSGINKRNIHDFCSAISDYAHLKSLSVELDRDDDLDSLDVIPQPPTTLNSLKLYGRVNKLLVWIEKLGNNLEKLKLDLTIEKPEELQPLDFQIQCAVGQVRIRPIQDGDLHFRGRGWAFARVVEIKCTSVLHIKFDDQDISHHVELLKVHFSRGSKSSWQISGLSNLRHLKEVWLKGYTDEHRRCMSCLCSSVYPLNEGQARPKLKLSQPCVSSGSRSRLAGVMTCCACVLDEEAI